MKITVIKCPETGALFETEAAYRKHQRELKRAAKEQTEALAHQAKVQSIADQMLMASSVAQYFKWFEALEVAKAKAFPGNGKIIAIQLVDQSPIRAYSNGTTCVSVVVDIFLTKDTFLSWALHNSPIAPGFSTGCGNGRSKKKGDPVEACEVMRYQASLDLTKLPGLTATFKAIKDGRNEAALQKTVWTKSANAELLAAVDGKFLKKQQAATRLSKETKALHAKLQTACQALHAANADIQQELKDMTVALMAASPQVQEKQAALVALESQLLVEAPLI